jgi:hypothetical protein
MITAEELKYGHDLFVHELEGALHAGLRARPPASI